MLYILYFVVCALYHCVNYPIPTKKSPARRTKCISRLLCLAITVHL